MKTNHGCLTQEGLLVMNTAENRWQRYRELDIVHQISDLMEIALAYDLTHLWVHKEAEIADSVEFANFNPERWNLRVTWDRNEKNEARRIASAYGWKLPSGGQRQITLIWPHNTKWKWGGESNPFDLLRTVGNLEQALQVPVGGGPATVGWKMLQQLHGDWLDKPGVDLRQLHFGKEGARDLVWSRELSTEEQEMLYLHKFDKRSAYLAAAKSEFYGVGTPELIKGEASYTRRPGVGHDRVGIFHCRVCANDTPILRNHYKSGQYWLMGPIVRLLRAMKYEVEILEGWVFPEERQLLSSWVTNKSKTGLWDVRQSFREDTTRWRREVPRRNAEIGAKQIAVATIGLTSYRRFGDEETDKKRPDIKAQTVARNYELLFHNIYKGVQEHEIWPVMAYFDAIYYVSNEPNGLKVIPKLLEREGLGSFKYEGTISMTPEISHLLNIPDSVASKLETLNKKGWSKDV